MPVGLSPKIDRRYLILLGLIAIACTFATRFVLAAPPDPWTAQQTVQPAQFVEELRQEKAPHPLLIYVGVRALYNGGDISRAGGYGARGAGEGNIEFLKKMSGAPEDFDFVLFFVCCP